MVARAIILDLCTLFFSAPNFGVTYTGRWIFCSPLWSLHNAFYSHSWLLLFTGTGKTHTLKHIIQQLAGNVLVCASTGLSSVILSDGLQMQAKTVHSLFGRMDGRLVHVYIIGILKRVLIHTHSWCDIHASCVKTKKLRMIIIFGWLDLSFCPQGVEFQFIEL